MKNQIAFKRKLPVIYRWLRRRRYFAHAAALVCVLVVLPIGLIGGVKISHIIATNEASAATQALAPDRVLLADMNPRERARVAAKLGEVIAQKPDRLRHMAGQDLEVLFRAPDLRRQDGNVSVWQFRNESCVLDVYLTAGADGPGTVADYDIRLRQLAAFGGGGDQQKPDAASCLNGLYRKDIL